MKEPKIVVWDLETMPDARQIYRRIPSIGAWPGRTFKAELQTIISFGYKIHGQEEAKCVNAWDFKDHWNQDRHDDSALVQFIYDMLHDADQIVTHNGKQFDIKVLNTRLAKYGMPPIAKDIIHVDTKQSAKKLSLYSNSLAEVAKFFGCDDKMTFGSKWSLWERIAFKDESKEDLKLMSDYCKQDVETLDQIYLKLMPYHSRTVNRNQFDERGVCPSCGNPDLIKHGFKRTKTNLKQRYLCTSCGSTSQQDTKGRIS